MAKVLVVEDNIETQLLIKHSLAQHETVVAKDLKEAEGLVSTGPYDMVLLDVRLPDGDGFRFYSSMRTRDVLIKVPVIFLSGCDAPEDVIMGLSLGADDYLTKPFNPFVLKAKIDARLRSANQRAVASERVEIGDITLDALSHRAWITKGGNAEPVDLTPIEFKLLLHLVRSPDRIFTRDQLIEKLWGVGVDINDRTIDAHVSNLRKKIKQAEHTVASIYGTGYSLRKNKSA